LHGFVIQRTPYLTQHLLGVFQDVVIPEPQQAITGCLQNPSTLVIVFGLLQMLAAVGLHYQLALDADEIGDVAGNTMLSAKLVSQLLVAQT
jgi:hypothetical protein